MPGFEGSMLNIVALASIVPFPKQHYESIVPEKSDINTLSASHWFLSHVTFHYVHVYELFLTTL